MRLSLIFFVRISPPVQTIYKGGLGNSPYVAKQEYLGITKFDMK